MAEDKETLIKRYESTADTYQAKGDREWAYAKNGKAIPTEPHGVRPAIWVRLKEKG